MSKYEIVELQQFSGKKAKIYSIIAQGETETLFEKFVRSLQGNFSFEVNEITARLYHIGNTTGIRDGFFRHEGNKEFVKKVGKYVYALFDDQEKNLRLFCIKFGKVAIILGGGGNKPKEIKKWQEDPELALHVNQIIDYAECIINQIDNREIRWSKDGTELEGKLRNFDYEN